MKRKATQRNERRTRREQEIRKKNEEKDEEKGERRRTRSNDERGGRRRRQKRGEMRGERREGRREGVPSCCRVGTSFSFIMIFQISITWLNQTSSHELHPRTSSLELRGTPNFIPCATKNPIHNKYVLKLKV